ncbi:MAG: hypothetical protein ACLP8S_33495 [Solirubrobacteraceae bacterium]
MKSGPTPAFVLARVFALTAPAWLPVSDSSSLRAERSGGRFSGEGATAAAAVSVAAFLAVVLARPRVPG